MRSALGTVYEIWKLIKKSPKRNTSVQKLKQELAPDTPGFRVICPTRWTVRAASLHSVLDNYEVLLGVWTEAQEGHLDSEIRARVIRVEAQMLTFDFLFGELLGSLILRHRDNLNKSLQHEHVSCRGSRAGEANTWSSQISPPARTIPANLPTGNKTSGNTWHFTSYSIL